VILVACGSTDVPLDAIWRGFEDYLALAERLMCESPDDTPGVVAATGRYGTIAAVSRSAGALASEYRMPGHYRPGYGVRWCAHARSHGPHPARQ
jgi:hypothetical protein